MSIVLSVLRPANSRPAASRIEMAHSIFAAAFTTASIDACNVRTR
jgi:hypothetical protein